MLTHERVTSDDRRMLTTGNTKLGPLVHGFGLPAASTCPGRTAYCERHCYALSGRFLMPSVRRRYRKNYQRSKRADFVDKIGLALRWLGVQTLRVHVSGDFYDAEYVRKWIAIAEAAPRTTFFAYTRSWRVPEIAPDLRRLASTPNWRLWCSLDRETGEALGWENRSAFMVVDDLDELLIPPSADLVFRDSDKTVAKKLEGVQVCPAENGIEYAPPITCTRCQICFRKPEPAQPTEHRSSVAYLLRSS